MDIALARPISQLHHGSRSPMNAVGTQVRRRIRNGALALASLALVFYAGFIVLLVIRHH